MADIMWAAVGREWVLAALPVIAEDDDLRDSDALREYREPTAGDLPDYAAEIADAVQDWMREDQGLSSDDGWPCLNEQAFAAAIREAVASALAEHTDFSEATWQPTGRTMTVGEARTLLWGSDVNRR